MGKLITAAASVLLTLIPFCTFAQENQSSWGPTHPPRDSKQDQTQNDPNTLGTTMRGFNRPSSCTGMDLITQQLVALCVATPQGYFWRWYDFNVYKCRPDGTPTFRTVEYARSTDKACKKSSWEITKKFGASFGENWDSSISEGLEESSVATDDQPSTPSGGRPTGRTSDVVKLDKDGKVVEKETKTDKEVKTTTTGGGGATKTDKKPKKRVAQRPKKPVGETTTQAPSSNNEMIPAALMGVGVGIGLGRGTHGGGMREEHGDFGVRR
jgi:hypothetical protein